MKEMGYDGSLSEGVGADGFRRFLYRIGDGLLRGVLITNAVLIAVFVFSPYKLLVVRSGSMEPALPVGSIVIAERVQDTSKLQVGDIVTYRNPAVPFTITHRIIEVMEEGFVTKGDNLEANDGEIPKEWVRYRVTGCFVLGASCWSGNGVKGQYAGVISS